MNTVTVVGNGAIGLVTAIQIRRKLEKAEVICVGPSHRNGSASYAAGAMANVFAEIEKVPESQSNFEHRSLQVGIRGSNGWRELLSELNLEKWLTASDTLVLLKKDASEFELGHYDEMENVAKGFGIATPERPESLDFLWDPSKFDRGLRLRGEFALDARGVLASLESVASAMGVKFVDEEVASILQGAVVLANGKTIRTTKTIVAAGAQTGVLLRDLGLLKMLQGEGTALVASRKQGPRLNVVLRTVNRGGAQCGVHLVPTADGGIYIGAGNSVKELGPTEMRFETVRYLFDTAESEFLGRERAYSLTGNVLMGNRPRSVDGQPLIGPLAALEDVFVATGTNRVGLTWAPDIADNVIRWLKNKDLADDYQDWNPSRSAIPFSTAEAGISYFVESRMAAAYEHGLIKNPKDKAKREEFEIAARAQYLDAAAKGFGEQLHPDSWVAVNSNEK